MSRDLLLKSCSSSSKSPSLTRITTETGTKENSDQNVLSILTGKKNIISIEICPNFEVNRDVLKKLSPKFCTVPWLGRQDDKIPIKDIPAIKLSRELMEDGFNVMLHLAGRNLDKERVQNILEEAKIIGIKNIFVIQGDWHNVVEKDDAKCDFPYASDLVKFIREKYGNSFCIGVAGYPVGHPHSVSQQDDLMFLKNKVDNGANFIITQGIFDYPTLESFIKCCRNLKIDVPILPGIFIASSLKSLIAIKNICQVNIPDKVLKSYEILQDADVVAELGVNLIINLIKEIFEGELCPGVHIFSLNKLELVEKIVRKLKNS